MFLEVAFEVSFAAEKAAALSKAASTSSTTKSWAMKFRLWMSTRKNEPSLLPYLSRFRGCDWNLHLRSWFAPHVSIERLYSITLERSLFLIFCSSLFIYLRCFKARWIIFAFLYEILKAVPRASWIFNSFSTLFNAVRKAIDVLLTVWCWCWQMFYRKNTNNL